MIRNIVGFFKKIDDFLTACIDYIDLRVKTGKFPEDIQYLRDTTQTNLTKKEQETLTHFLQSKKTQTVIHVIVTQARIIRNIPLIGDLAFVFFLGIKIVLFYFFEVVVIFSVILLSFLFLVSVFQQNAFVFSLALLPTGFADLLLVCVLYHFIAKKEQRLPATLVDGIQQVTRTTKALMMMGSMHVFLILAAISFFLLIAFLFSLLFTMLGISWENSFVYWIIIIPLLFSLLFAITLFSITCYHAYFFISTTQQKPLQALRQSWNYLKGTIVEQFFFFFIIILCFIPLFSWAFSNYFSFGVALILGVYVQVVFCLTYLLERLFPPQSIPLSLPVRTSLSPLLFFSLLIGASAFLMLNGLFIQQYPYLQEFLWQKEQDATFAKELNAYTNEALLYTVRYPKDWTIYHWQENETTFYNNYNGSQAGGIWVTISVHPIFSPDYNFEMLRNSKSGLVAYNTGTQTIVTKVSDTQIDGHEAVVYTFSVPYERFPQFQRHYLIKKDEKLYDIEFVTLSKDVERRMSEVFEKMIQSFQFLEEGDHSQQGSL